MTTGPMLAVLLLLLTGHVTGDWINSGQYQYLLSTDKVSWDNGLGFCAQQKQTAFLVRPTSENAEFLKSFGSEDIYWADHRYVGTTKGWVWSDGSSIGDDHWHSGYPKPVPDNSLGCYERASATLMNTIPNYYTFQVVCQAPLDPTPEPTTTTHKPTTTKPEPTTTTPEPTTTTPEPTTTTPQPTTTKPEPTTTTPEPTATTPQPTTTKPEPTTTTLEPTTTKPEPTGTTPKPTSAATTASPAPCPSGAGWVDLGTGDGRCYYLSAADPAEAGTRLSWTAAQQACVAMDADLASVPDQPSFYALSFRVSDAGVDAWTGLFNIPGIGLRWTDDSEFSADLDQFVVVNGTDPYGYLSHGDGNFHMADSIVTKAFVCSMYSSHPVTGSTPAPTASPCPADWEQFADTCYLFSDDQQIWTTAVHRCLDLGADLVSIHDQSLIFFLLLKAGQDVYWTGLQNEGGVYVWQDGSDTGDIALLTPYLDKWTLGKDCVEMDKSAQYFVHDNCFAERRFVCQRPMD